MTFVAWGEGLGVTAINWVTAVLDNSLGRYERRSSAPGVILSWREQSPAAHLRHVGLNSRTELARVDIQQRGGGPAVAAGAQLNDKEDRP
jgi:hypothetical protein